VAEDLDALFGAIRARLAELGPQVHRRESFIAHLRSLARWEADADDRVRGEYPFQNVFMSPSRSVILSAARGSSSSTGAHRSARPAVVR